MKPSKHDPIQIVHELGWDLPLSIYEHIKRHIDPLQDLLPDCGQCLPDDQTIYHRDGYHWAPGAFDCVMRHHAPQVIDNNDNFALIRLILDDSMLGEETKRFELYARTRELKVMTGIDQLIEEVGQDMMANPESLYDLACWMATESIDREPVKLGLALLSLFPEKPIEPLLRIFGRHEEFTRYCEVATSNWEESRRLDLIKELLPHVSGWGLVSLVQRLAGTPDREIQDWMVRDAGRKSSYLRQYVAFTIATTGNLRDALLANEVSYHVLRSAGNILTALIEIEKCHRTEPNSRYPGIHQYHDAPIVMQRYLFHMEKQAQSVFDVVYMGATLNFLSDSYADWTVREDMGFTDSLVRHLRTQVQDILHDKEWYALVYEGLESSSDEEYMHAVQAANLLEIRDLMINVTRYKQISVDRVSRTMGSSDRIRRNNDNYLEEAKDLIRLATLPRDFSARDLKAGYRYRVPFFQSDFQKYPDQAAILIEIAISRNNRQHRQQGLEMLDIWGYENWPRSVLNALLVAAQIETAPDLQKKIAKLIDGLALAD